MEGEPSSFQSLDHVKASELFPKPVLSYEEPGLEGLYTLTYGEGFEAMGRITGGFISLSNYKLYVVMENMTIYNIPRGVIESVDFREVPFILVLCKDGRSFKFSCATSEVSQEWSRRLTQAIGPVQQIEAHFGFSYRAWAIDECDSELLKRLSLPEKTFQDEGTTPRLWHMHMHLSIVYMISWDYLQMRLIDCKPMEKIYLLNEPSQITLRGLLLYHTITLGAMPSFQISRLKFNLEPNGPWKICQANEAYQLCPTYPRQLLVPAAVSDAVLVESSKFRVARRLPAVVWRHPRNGAVIARSSQPEVGVLYWRSEKDEDLVGAIRQACAIDCPEPRKINVPLTLKVMDARSYPTAFMNRARGGGSECVEYYPHTDIQFMGLANIHCVRKSFNLVRSLCAVADNSNWCSGLDNSKWLYYLHGLIDAALTAANALDREGRPVLVHCSDGWDRTPQIVSLTEILLDPYYRTLEGLQALIQREWLDFGHKFGDRCGNSVNNDDGNERCPVFLQWLDCVHQLLLQFPCSFEYNESLLVRLVQHTYSNLYGTFLGNSPKERSELKITERTFSIWPLFRDERFKNLLYEPFEEALWPSSEVRDLKLWTQVFVTQPSVTSRPNIPTACTRDTSAPRPVEPDIQPPGISNGHNEIDGAKDENETEPVVTNGYSHSVTENGEDETDNSELPASMQRVRQVGKNRTISEGLYDLYYKPNEQPTELFALTEECSSNAPMDFTSDSNGSDSDASKLGTPPVLLNNSDASTDMPGVRPVLDIDGMITIEDPVQLRLRSIIEEYRVRELALQKDLKIARMDSIRLRYGRGEDEVSRPDSTNGSDQNPASLPSDLSWEALEERELQATLWVPDHAVSKCKGCSSQFWIGRRKHHCRRCGNIFCSDCSEHAALIPGEDLYYPVRVCNTCHSELEPNNVINSNALL